MQDDFIPKSEFKNRFSDWLQAKENGVHMGQVKQRNERPWVRRRAKD